MSAQKIFDLKVFYLWDFGISSKVDHGFSKEFTWDVPLLDGYEHEFVQNISRCPGTHNFFGLDNPHLFQRVAAFRPDAVLLMNYNYLGLYKFIMSWDKTPLLFRGDSHRLVKNRGMLSVFRRFWISLIMKRFAAILYVGTANREYSVCHGFPKEKLFFSPHAIDNQRYFNSRVTAENEAVSWKRELGIPSGDLVVLFAGKFIGKKRPLDLLDAFKLADMPGVSLLFVGSGEMEGRLKSEAAGETKVFCAPFQNQSRMPIVYAACDVFVLPSYGRDETWGLSVNEAMCMSKAVIVSDHVGCHRDLVIPGRNGLIFKAGNVRCLKEALIEALSSREHLLDWGAESRRMITAYSYAEATEGLTSAVDSVIRGRSEGKK